MNLLQKIVLGMGLLTAPAYAQEPTTRTLETLTSFSAESSPSLEPLMLTRDAHTLLSVLHSALNKVEPQTSWGRALQLGVGVYGQEMITLLAHEFGHYSEAKVDGRHNVQLHLERLLIFQSYESHDIEPGNEKLKEELGITGRGMAINQLLAQEIITFSMRRRTITPFDALSYVLNHSFPSAYTRDLAIYNNIVDEIYTDDNTADRIKRQSIAVGIFNAVDPYALTSFWGVGRYVISARPSQQLPPFWVPQLNGYVGIPGPLYEACWYAGEKTMYSLAVRLGLEPEESIALRAGIAKTLLWKKMKFSAVGEILHAGSNGGTVHAELSFPVGQLHLGPAYSFKSEDIWTPLVSGLPRQHIFGVVAGLDL